MSQLKTITAVFNPPCLLPRQKLTMWTVSRMVRPALVKKEFGRADLLLAISPIQHRPSYYLVWVDSRWMEEQTMAEHVDDICDAIAEEFGSRSWDDETYKWPMEDFADGSVWRKASADDILTVSQRRKRGLT